MLHRVLLAGVVIVGISGWTSAAPAPGLPYVPLETSPRPCYGLLVATIRDGVIYTIDESPQDGPISVRLWQAPLHPVAEGRREGISRTFRGWDYAWTLDLLHWRIAYDHVWAECGLSARISRSYHIPLEDLSLFDAQNAERGAAALRQKYRDTEADNAHWFFTLLPDFANELLKRLLSERAGHNIGGAREGEVEYDILPTGPKAWDGFLLFESRLTLYHCTQKPRAKGEPPLAGVQLRVESKKCSEPIDTGFHEPFYAYGKPEAPFFVTKSGKVFQLQRPEKGQPRVEKVWDDSKRPVRAILDDTDGGRTFVAGPDLPQGAGRWFWFELANKPEPKPYDPAAVKVEAEEPLKPALAFARFLLKEGKLKAK